MKTVLCIIFIFFMIVATPPLSPQPANLVFEADIGGSDLQEAPEAGSGGSRTEAAAIWSDENGMERGENRKCIPK